MAAAIDMLDNSWNPQRVLRAMQQKRNQQLLRHGLRTSWDDFVILRSDKLEHCIKLKRLGLEEMACIVDG